LRHLGGCYLARVGSAVLNASHGEGDCPPSQALASASLVQDQVASPPQGKGVHLGAKPPLKAGARRVWGAVLDVDRTRVSNIRGQGMIRVAALSTFYITALSAFLFAYSLLPIPSWPARKEIKMPDTIITGGGGDSGMGAGMIIAIVLVIVLLIAGGYLVINHGSSGSTVNVDVPKVTVTTPAKG
jgi:hypothetical protein